MDCENDSKHDLVNKATWRLWRKKQLVGFSKSCGFRIWAGAGGVIEIRTGGKPTNMYVYRHVCVDTHTHNSQERTCLYLIKCTIHEPVII